jgi:lipopolysaccharide/colanic/teichoic acid biosynthesis glycosyltransferase
MGQESLLRPIQPCCFDIPWLIRYNPDNRILSERQYLIAKRIMDLSVVVLTAPLWLVALALCALAIKLESPRAPVLYRQRRTGRAGRPIQMLKFRTMVPNAKEMEAQLAHLNKLKWPDFKIDNDPRVTRVGRILRKTSLDELPQMFNILRGEMSLVGPRPTSFLVETYTLWETARLDVLPGMTGLWQITHRTELEFYDRARLDILYVQHRCLMLDIEILLRTIPAALRGKGAH